MPSQLLRALRSPVVVLAALAIVVSVSCGSDSTVTTESDGAPTTTRRGSSSTEVAAIIDVSGGFVPVEVAVRSMPQLTAYKDGRVFTVGATIAIFPGPALTPLVRSTASAAELARIERLARDHRLDRADVDYGDPPIADAPTTTVTVTVDGTTYVHAAYSLGAGIGDISGVGVARLTDDQRRARADLQAFVDAVEALRLGEEGEIVIPDRYRLFVTDAPPIVSGPSGGPQVRVVDWEIDGITLDATRCLPVEDPRLVAALEELFSEADTLTTFRTTSGARYDVVVRPVLPHEATCPA